MKVFEHVSLKSFNTFGLEAKARYFAEITSLEAYLRLCESGKYAHVPHLFLGGGSNILITRNIKGLVINLNMKGISSKKIDDNHTEVKINSGENWNDCVKWCLKNNLGGIENLSLIPGNSGAAPIQNIGAYGVELDRFVVSVEVLDAQSGLAETLMADDCQFQYRDSLFKRHPARFVVTRLTLKLNPRFEPVLAYHDLQTLPAQSTASPQGLRRAIQSIRAHKLPDHRIVGNVGSFFKNPILSKTVIETLEQSHVIHPNARNAQGKVSAAALIQAAALGDLHVGQAGISPKHHLVLENRGGATLTDILTLASLIQETIQTRFGIRLEIEPQQLTPLIHAPNPNG